MATYKYQQNLFYGAGEGYVQYNISPDFGTPLAVGETFEITGKMYSRDLKRYGLTVEASLTVGGISRELGRVEKVCSKGRTATFSMTGTITDALANLSDERGFTAYLSFVLMDSADFSSGAMTTADEAQQVSALAYRLPPVINAATINDSTGAYAHFGGAVDGKSDLSFALDVTLDPLDPSLVLTSAVFIVGDIRRDIDSSKIDGSTVTLGVIDFNGAFGSWLLVVYDSKGQAGSYTGGSIVSYPYSAPRLATPGDRALAERYSVSLDDAGNEVVTLDDAGTYLWANYIAEVASINGKNTWTITRSYAVDGYTLNNSAVIRSGEDGGVFSGDEDQSVFPREITFDANKVYAVQLDLSDYFSTVSLVSTVDKAGGYFNIEKYGVAAGMRSTATEGDPKFESAYPVYPYAGIEGATNYKEGEETTYGKWIDGKTIYRRVVPINVTQIGTTVDVITIADAEQLLRIEGCYVDADGACYPPTFYFTTSNYIATYWADNTLRIRSTRTLTGYAILSYTKTVEDDNGGDSGDTESTVERPAAAMTSNSSQGCVASASSEYSNNTYAAWRAFNKSHSDQYGWAAASGVLDAWLQLEMDVALKNISVTIINRTYTYVNGPENGVIYGSNDGAEWTSIGTFSGRDGSAKGGKTVHECNNDEIAYRYVRVNVNRSSGGLVAIGEMIINGVEVG